MTIAEVSTVCFVGAGTMGCANSLVAAIAGYHAVLFDVAPEGLVAAEQRQNEIGDYLVGVGFATAAQVAGGHERVSRTTDLAEATARAELVSESVFERLELKRSVHTELDRVSPAHTILTTNTSSLLVSDIEDAVERGERFAALHSHLGSLLVDIVGGPRTSPETIDILERYVVSLGATPLVLKREHRGYVANAMIGGLLTEALRLHLEDGVAIDVIDASWMQGQGAPLGPFGMIDLFGLDLLLDHWSGDTVDPSRHGLQPHVIALLRARVDAGSLGLKSGSGFYTYPDPGASGLDLTSGSPQLAETLFEAVATSARALVSAGVASADDVDRAWITATQLSRPPLANHQNPGGTS